MKDRARRRSLAGVFIGLALLVSGCATLTPEQEAKAARIRTFAERIARAYGVPALWIQVGTHTADQAATFGGDRITVSTQALGWPERSWKRLLAHEYGHYLLDHARRLQVAPDWRQLAPIFELEAERKAVEILRRVEGMSEAEAVKVFLDHYRVTEPFLAAGRGQYPATHPPIREKFLNLCRHFPASTAGEPECR